MTCSKCGNFLNDSNWLPSRKKRNQKICCICVRQDNNQRYGDKKSIYSVSDKNKRANIKKDRKSVV